MDNKSYIRLRCELNGKDYKPFTVFKGPWDRAITKIVKDSLGKHKYHINYYLYEPTRDKNDPVYGLSAEVHFYRNNTKDWFIVKYEGQNETTVKHIESFFEELYSKMDCEIDPHNN